MREQKFDLVISDIKMPKLNGVQTLEKIKEIDPTIEVIMLTGFGTVETAVQSMKKGAYDYLSKPFNFEEVMIIIEKALEKREIKVLLGLYEMSKAIFATVNLNELLRIVTDILIKTMNADEMLFFLYNEDRQLDLVTSYGIEKDPVIEKSRIEMCQAAVSTLVERNTPIAFSIDSNNHEWEQIKVSDGIKASVIYPLGLEKKKMGLLCLNKTSTVVGFTDNDIKNLGVFMSHIAQAVENAQLYELLKKKIDELKLAYDRLDRQKDQLIEREKLSAIGRLVSGIAHELNNPLMVIMGILHLFINNMIDGSEFKNKLETLYEQAERCRGIVQNLMLFSRQRPPLKEWVNIEEIIDDVLAILTHEIKTKKISIRKDFSENIPEIFVDSDQVRQVFLNIVNNAVYFMDAVSDGRKRQLMIEIKQDGDSLIVAFQDNGIGISSEDLKNIFDPFFTTKEVRQGTGLGMSLCYGIMQQHGGNIFIESEKGKGSVFEVEFKIAGTKDHKILVIDDEKDILDLVKKFLVQSGCNKVDTVAEGKEALNVLEKKDYDIVLCDIHMSGLSGKEIYQKIKEKDDSLAEKVIFLTGNVFDKQTEEFLENTGNKYLQKPFRIEELISTIDSLRESRKK